MWPPPALNWLFVADQMPWAWSYRSAWSVQTGVPSRSSTPARPHSIAKKLNRDHSQRARWLCVVKRVPFAPGLPRESSFVHTFVWRPCRVLLPASAMTLIRGLIGPLPTLLARLLRAGLEGLAAARAPPVVALAGTGGAGQALPHHEGAATGRFHLAVSLVTAATSTHAPLAIERMLLRHFGAVSAHCVAWVVIGC